MGQRSRATTVRKAVLAHGFAVLVLGYSATLWAFWLIEGDTTLLSTTFFALVAIPVVGLLGGAYRKPRPWLALVVVALSFQVIAAPVDAMADTHGALSLFDFDRYVWGLNLTGWVQGAFASGALTDAAALVYLALIPFVLAVSLLIWWWRRAVFGSYVAAMVLTSYAALVTFVLMPTVPPWLGGAALNLVSGSGVGALAGSLAPFAQFYVPDYFAAFPSLHAAYLITGAYFLFRVDRRLGVAGAAAAGATLFATLYLGQHYAVDLIGGAAYSLVPCMVSERFRPASRAAASQGPSGRAPPP